MSWMDGQGTKNVFELLILEHIAESNLWHVAKPYLSWKSIIDMQRLVQHLHLYFYLLRQAIDSSCADPALIVRVLNPQTYTRQELAKCLVH